MARYSYVPGGPGQPLVQVPSFAAQTMVAPAVGPVLSSAVSTTAATGGREFLAGLVNNLIAGIAIEGAQKVLFNPAAGAMGPSTLQTEAALGRSNYFISPAQQLEAEKYLAGERVKRALLGLVPGMGDVLPPVPSREELVGGFVDGQFVGQAALTEAQAQSLTAREISRIRAEKEYDYAARLAEAQASIQREKIRALADAQAKVESQKVTSLGDVQRQRLQSQYGAASNLLDSAIKNIAFRDKIESADTLTELARAV
jgi:hypothetical protein